MSINRFLLLTAKSLRLTFCFPFIFFLRSILFIVNCSIVRIDQSAFVRVRFSKCKNSFTFLFFFSFAVVASSSPSIRFNVHSFRAQSICFLFLFSFFDHSDWHLRQRRREQNGVNNVESSINNDFRLLTFISPDGSLCSWTSFHHNLNHLRNLFLYSYLCHSTNDSSVSNAFFLLLLHHHLCVVCFSHLVIITNEHELDHWSLQEIIDRMNQFDEKVRWTMLNNVRI